MLIETCQVTAVTSSEMWLESRAKKDCVACAKGVGCGGGLLAKLSSQPTAHLCLPRDPRAQTHQHWEVAIPERVMLLAALISYFLPLIFCLVVAISLSALAPQIPDLAIAALSFAALVLGHRFGRRLAAGMDLAHQVKLLKPVSAPCQSQTTDN